MDDPKMVYVVTSGEYSGYGINAVFSTEEAAERYCEAHNSGRSLYDQDYRVEPYELDQPNRVTVSESGEAVWVVGIGGADGVARASIKHDDDENDTDRLGDNGDFRTDVRAKDKETAIKIAQERLMHHKAVLAGMT